MTEELERILTNMEDAGCGSEELKKAQQLYEADDTEALLRYFRRCRCSRMEELHESQRRVDCLDYLIRHTANLKTIRK
ncbi:MAG: hypothetical protein II795_01155 [Firmicutes bacterium]|nr:hypothetical protein [Bacillota bacterium]MBQ5960011.1 hypothetical protein [Bacillota bacterium]